MMHRPYFDLVPGIVLVATLSVLGMAGAIPIIVRSRRWLPAPQPVRGNSVRRLEALIIVTLALPVLLLILYDRAPGFDAFFELIHNRSEHLPLLFAEYTPGNIRLAWAGVLGLAVGTVVIAGVCSWRFSTTLAVLLLAAAFGFGVREFTQWQRMASLKMMGTSRTQVQAGHILFELPDQVEADLWINGVFVGKTPYHTTIQELVTKVPDTKSFMAGSMAQVVPPPDRRYDQYYRPGWAELKRAIEPLGGFWDGPSGERQRIALLQSVSVQVDLNGMKGFTKRADSEGLATRDGLTIVTLDTRFVEWETGLERLLDRARLENYQPPPEWYDAFLSYESRGWDLLQTQSKSEPELLRLVDGCAHHVYHIEQIQTPQQAWTTLMQISDEAVANGSYESDSCHGRAVELLVPKLDPEQLTLVLQKAFGDSPFPLVRYGLKPPSADGPLWSPRPRWSPPLPPEVLAIQPVFQAAWQLDRTLNKQQPDQANIVEERVTPALLRHVIRAPNHVPPYAEALGGPAFDQFLLRHDWKTGPDEFAVLDQNQQTARWFVGLLSHLDSDARSHFDSIETVGVGNASVNRWFYQLTYLDSPGGRQFRREHRDRLLQIAVRSLEPVKRPKAKTETERAAEMVTAAILSNVQPSSPGATPPHLDFLFLDRTFTADQKSLAMEFWPYYDRQLGTAPTSHITVSQLLQLRWNYLARLWPESTVEMFVQAYPERSPLYDYGIRGPETRRIAHYFLHDPVPPDVRFAILSGVRAKLQEKLRSLPDPQEVLGKKYIAVNDIEALGWCSQQFTCPESAAAFMESYQADDSSDKRDKLRERMTKDTVLNDLVELLAKHEDPVLRSMALLAIRNHPIARRVKLLDTLLNDADPTVRDEAARIHEELETLRTAPPRSRPGR